MPNDNTAPDVAVSGAATSGTASASGAAAPAAVAFGSAPAAASAAIPAPADPEEYLERAARLGPLIAGQADEAERSRRLPPALLDALHEAGLFRLLLPQEYGGAQLPPSAFAAVIQAIAEHDASTAWCLCQANGCAMAAAYLDPEVSRTIWGRDPRAVLAWGPGKGTAVREGDGYRVTGSWRFASGIRHAGWIGCESVVVDADGEAERHPDGRPVLRVLLVPAERVRIGDVWDVLGLLGTGSESFSVEDLRVSDAYALSRDDPEHRRSGWPLYLFPATNLYASGFSSVALGIARSALDAFTGLAREKRPYRSQRDLRDNHVVQANLALSVARLGSARSFLHEELDDIWSAVSAEGALAPAQRLRIRLATTWAIHQAKEVVDTVHEAAGATSVFRDNGFERRFRDMHTLTQQMQGRRAHFESVGAFLLGHEPDLSAA